MKNRMLVPMIVASMLLLGSASALACSAAGPNKHVGPITSIDSKGGFFTILDAQTQQPISFTASKEILDKAAKTKGTVTVNFKDDKGKLTAKDIH